uniref:Cytochrome c oxidase subunit 2 n=2 Tax=Corbicula TaxID=45948 RepID=A0A1B0ZD79_CORFM|nr:cytochrome c oxidase subunit II [Corbicula fluminea]QWS05871.1 cytochrome c oxidase subunit II [Corbicula leana]UJM44219.1 cytochrome c oxidase subunit 2 [Corbicula fluminea]
MFLSVWSQLWFPDPKTENAKNLILYHDITLVVVAVVLVLVVWFLVIFLMSKVIFGGMMNRYIHKNDVLEIVWTVSPSFILFILGYISLVNLYQMELGDETEHLVKVTGHQWYWDYEYLLSFNDFSMMNYSLWFSDMVSKYFEEVSSKGLAVMWVDILTKGLSELTSSYEGVVSSVSSEMVGLSNYFDSESLKADLNEVVYESSRDSVGEEVIALAGYMGVEDRLKDFGPVTEGGTIEDFMFSWRLMNLYGGIEKELAAGSESSIWFDLNYIWNLNLMGDFIVGKEASEWFSFDSMILMMEGDWVLNYESFLVPRGADSVEYSSYESGFRNADVTNPCFLARSSNNEVLVCTTDVMHSWGITELGVKVDAIPGRTNSLAVNPYSSGVCYGNCYELCGVGHSAMPIKVVVSSLKDTQWLLKSMIMTTDEVADLFSSWVLFN